MRKILNRISVKKLAIVFIVYGVLNLSGLVWAAQAMLPDPAGLSPAPKEYTVGPDDILGITILRPEKVELEVTVASDGTISLPYVGKVIVDGKTLSQLQKDIERQLREGYMRYPVVSVTLKQSLSQKFFIYGEVNKPGAYPWEPHMTVVRAVAVAGGFTRVGNLRKIQILRHKNNEQPEVLTMDMKAVTKGVGKDIYIESGDTILIPISFF